MVSGEPAWVSAGLRSRGGVACVLCPSCAGGGVSASHTRPLLHGSRSWPPSGTPCPQGCQLQPSLCPCALLRYGVPTPCQTPRVPEPQHRPRAPGNSAGGALPSDSSPFPQPSSLSCGSFADPGPAAVPEHAPGVSMAPCLALAVSLTSGSLSPPACVMVVGPLPPVPRGPPAFAPSACVAPLETGSSPPGPWRFQRQPLPRTPGWRRAQLLSVWHPLPTWSVPGSGWWVLGTPSAGRARPRGHTRAAWLLPTPGAWGSGLLLPAPVARGVCFGSGPRNVGPRCRSGPAPAAHSGVCGLPQWMLLGSLCALPPPALGHLELWAWAIWGRQGRLATGHLRQTA